MADRHEQEMLEYAASELADINVPCNQSADIFQRRANAINLLQSSPGLLFSDFDFGDELIIETDRLEDGQDGYMAITLVPWGEQHEIPAGVPIRVAVDETNIPELSGVEDMYISGASLPHVEFCDTCPGQIRSQCNVWFSALEFTAFEKTLYARLPDEELSYHFERGVLEYRNRGYFRNYTVGVSLAKFPTFLPLWVRSVSVIDDINQRAQRVDWKSPHYLTAKTCIIDTDES
jgi:hypothetical protein